MATSTQQEPGVETQRMGLSYAELELANYDDVVAAKDGRIKPDQVRRMKVKCLADSGALMLAINEEIAAQLGLPQVEERLAEMADGSIQKFPVVGPIEVRFGNRRTFTTAMVLPKNSEPLLGTIPMEDMDLLIDPKTQQVIINPAMPYISKKPMK
jgi:clan AA aspartic protease